MRFYVPKISVVRSATQGRPEPWKYPLPADIEDISSGSADLPKQIRKETNRTAQGEKKKPSVDRRPALFDYQDCDRRRTECNHGVDKIPHGIMRFDPTEMEGPLRLLLHAQGQWDYVPAVDGPTCDVPHVKSGEEAHIDDLVGKSQLHGNRAAYVRERMITMQGELADRLSAASADLERDGASYMLNSNMADSNIQREGEISPNRRDGVIQWGMGIRLGDCEVQGVALGKLHFHAVDYADTIRLSERGRVHLEGIGPQGGNQCVYYYIWCRGHNGCEKGKMGFLACRKYCLKPRSGGRRSLINRRLQ